MKEVVVSSGPTTELRDVPIPNPGPNQVLIKIVVSGSNPKDWMVPGMVGPHNTGDDIAGIVEAIGTNVVEFKPGDRVAAFHEMMKPFGSFAEYGIAWAHTTFHLPKNTTFEEGATIPLAAMTAALALYQDLGLPAPWRPTKSRTPLIIYGGSSAVGAYAIKLAKISNIHPLICVAGRAQGFVEGLIDRTKGDAVIDYREGDAAVTNKIKSALQTAGFSEAHYAFDAISEHNSHRNIIPVLAKQNSSIAVIKPQGDFSDVPDYVQILRTYVGSVHQDLSEQGAVAGKQPSNNDFGHVYFRLFSKGLQDGWFTAHPFEVVSGGLNGVEKGLKDLQGGVNSGLKYVFRIEETV